jgi:hypothetical protein
MSFTSRRQPEVTQVYESRHVRRCKEHSAHLRQQCHNSKLVIVQEKRLKVLKCYNFLWVQRRHNCSRAASFANCVMTLYLLKVRLQTILSIPITQKCQILSCDKLVANERYLVNALECVWVRWETLDSALEFGVNDSCSKTTKRPNANIWSHSKNYTKH